MTLSTNAIILQNAYLIFTVLDKLNAPKTYDVHEITDEYYKKEMQEDYENLDRAHLPDFYTHDDDNEPKRTAKYYDDDPTFKQHCKYSFRSTDDFKFKVCFGCVDHFDLEMYIDLVPSYIPTPRYKYNVSYDIPNKDFNKCVRIVENDLDIYTSGARAECIYASPITVRMTAQRAHNYTNSALGNLMRW